MEKVAFFFSHQPQIKWYSIFAQAFKNDGDQNKVVLFVHGNEDFNYAKGFEGFDVIIDLVKGFNYLRNKTEISFFNKQILDLEQKCNKSFIWDDIRTDRWLRVINNKDFVIKYINYSFERFVREYKKHKPVFGFGEATMAIYRLAKRYFEHDNRLYIAPIATLYFNRFYFEDSWDWLWTDSVSDYKFFLDKGIREKYLKVVSPIYENIVKDNGGPIAFKEYKRKNSVGFDKIHLRRLLISLRLTVKVKRSAKDENFFNNPRNYYLETLVLKKLWRNVSYRINLKRYKKLITNSIDYNNINYAVYFLHYQPEYTVDSLGRFYMDQISLIKNIAASLPANMVLLVKEHIPMVGLRNGKFYSELNSSKNVYLVDHLLDSEELIKKAKLVFTIVGTAALEASFFGVPAIIFGKYTFAEIFNIRFCSNYWELSSLIRESLVDKRSKEDAKKHAFAFLASQYLNSFEGQLPLTSQQIDNISDKDKRLIAKSFLQFLNKVL